VAFIKERTAHLKPSANSLLMTQNTHRSRLYTTHGQAETHGTHGQICGRSWDHQCAWSGHIPYIWREVSRGPHVLDTSHCATGCWHEPD
jgi:hypothetical protein